MARERKSAQMQEQIRVLLRQGHSIRKVALALGISRQTVRRFSVTPEETGGGDLGTPAAQQPAPPSSVEWDHAIDWTEVAAMARNGTTVKQLHAELAPEVTYTRFRRRLLSKSPRVAAVSLRQEHQAGEKTQVDYCDGIPVIERGTGEVRKTQLFCGVLPFSAYTFGEFVWSQRLDSFIASHERMWAYFGGVTPYVVIDNLKAGVKAAHRYDPDVNPTYCEYGNHQGFAVLPARPYRPRDKAGVEAAIGAIQRGFWQEVRSRSFYSLDELNAVFREYLERFNATVMKDHGRSRAERFASEQPLLRELPKERYELMQWGSAKVHPDCHVQIDKNFYSVPYTLVGQTVRVRRSDQLIEVFLDGESVSAHHRVRGIGKYVTDDRHLPAGKKTDSNFLLERALADAKRIGPRSEELIQRLIENNRPLRYLRRVQGILRIYRKEGVSPAAAEYASGQALSFRKLRVAFIQNCINHYTAHGARPVPVAPARSQNEVHLHSAVVAAGGES
jgi:transposase